MKMTGGGIFASRNLIFILLILYMLIFKKVFLENHIKLKIYSQKKILT